MALGRRNARESTGPQSSAASRSARFVEAGKRFWASSIGIPRKSTANSNDSVARRRTASDSSPSKAWSASRPASLSIS